MISQTAQYALRAIVCLAAMDGRSLTVSELADKTSVSAEYLSKVMQALVRADLVTSKPGKNGGFSLKPPLQSLTLLTIIDAIDPPTASGEAFPLELQSYGHPLQPLHKKMQQLNALWRSECNKIPLSDIIP